MENKKVEQNVLENKITSEEISQSSITEEKIQDINEIKENKDGIKTENVDSNEIDIIKESLKEIANDIDEMVDITIGDEIIKEGEVNDIEIDSINKLISKEINDNNEKNFIANDSENILNELKDDNEKMLIDNLNEIKEKNSGENSLPNLNDMEKSEQVTEISIEDNKKENIEENNSIELKDSENFSNSINNENNESNDNIDVLKEPKNDNKEKEKEKENDNDKKTSNIDSDSDNESESDSDSDSSSDSSSSDFDTDSSDDDSDSSSEDDILTKEKVEKHKKTIDKYNEDIDDENDDNTINLIHSTHEIISLPKVQPITIDIPKDIPITKIGVIQNIVDEYVLIQATVSGNYQVLDEDSILLFNDRTPVGRIFETLGPVSLPIYSIRFNSASEIDKEKYKVGTDVFFNPELAKLSYTQQIKLIKGSDASNQYDEEPGEDEIEFSDDEKEIEYKKNLKNKKKEKGNERKRKLNDNKNPTGSIDSNNMEYEPLQRDMSQQPPSKKGFYSQPSQPGYKNYPNRKPMPYKPYPPNNNRGGGRGRRFYGKYYNQNTPSSYLPPPMPMNSMATSMNPLQDMNYMNTSSYDYYGNPLDFNQSLNRRAPPLNSNPMIIDYGSSENDIPTSKNNNHNNQSNNNNNNNNNKNNEQKE